MTLSLWPVHPHPLPDELLSSWLIRLARGNGFKVHSFCASFFGRERQIWNRDVDHHAPAWLLSTLSERTGSTHEQIVQTTLRAFESFVFERFSELGGTRWVLPLSVFHRTRRSLGQQFCSQCLREDSEPYLRRSWRLALSVVCVHHKALLCDSCPQCSSPMTPHRADMTARGGFPEKTTMLRCFKCGSRMDEVTVPALAEDVRMQAKIDAAVRDGFAEVVPGIPIYSPLYFDGLRMMMRVGDMRGTNRARKRFEHESINSRLDLLKAALDLTVDWPTRLLDRCAAIPHAFTSITSNEPSPYWLDAVLRQYVLKRRALISDIEAKAIIAEAMRRDSSACLGVLTRNISGRDIGRLLPPLPPVSDDSADLLIASLDRQISIASAQGRLLLLRDKVIFMAARCFHLSVPDMLALTLSELELDATGDEEFSFWERVDSHERAWAMLRWYVREVRSKLALGNTKALFVTARGTPIKRNAIGMRFSIAVSTAQLERAIPDWTRWVGLARSM